MKTKNQEQFESEPEEKGVEEAAREMRKELGLGPEITLKQMKKIYRALALQFHPDNNPVDRERATQIFKRLKELYEILCNEIELSQNEAEDEFRDKEKDRDLEGLGDVFLPGLGTDIDPVMRRIIEAYQKKQSKQKGANINIKA